MALPEILKTQSAHSGRRRAAVHHLASAAGAGPVQGRRRRLVSGAQRAARSAARRMAGRDHRGPRRPRRRQPGTPAAPFAVNQIVHKSNTRLEHDLTLCVKYKVPIVISSLGAVQEVNAGGPFLWRHRAARHHPRPPCPQGHREGRRRADRGCGRRRRPCRHAVALRAGPGNPPDGSTGRCCLSGAIANGGAVLAAQAMGADMAYIGSPFIATDGGARHRRLQADDRRHRRPPTSSIPTCSPASTATTSRARSSPPGMDPDNLPAVRSVQDGFRAATTSAKAWKDIWGCGQGIGASIEVVPAAELIDRLAREYEAGQARNCWPHERTRIGNPGLAV